MLHKNDFDFRSNIMMSKILQTVMIYLFFPNEIFTMVVVLLFFSSFRLLSFIYWAVTFLLIYSPIILKCHISSYTHFYTLNRIKLSAFISHINAITCSVYNSPTWPTLDVKVLRSILVMAWADGCWIGLE